MPFSFLRVKILSSELYNCMNQYRIKYWLYKNDQWIISILVMLLSIVIIITFVDIVQDGEFIQPIEFRAWVAIVAGLITLLFAFMKQKHNDMSVFFHLFEKFNQRYDELNDLLNSINEITRDESKIQEYPDKHPFEWLHLHLKHDLRRKLYDESAVKKVLDDYLNLCAEEYLAYSNGYVPPEIMQYWYNGMKIFFQNNYIRDYFREEFRNDSYYQFKNFALKKFDEIDTN